jgi:hypothetical protein
VLQVEQGWPYEPLHRPGRYRLLLSLRCFFEARYLISLRPLGTLNDIELYFVALFETFVALALDGTVVDEDIGPAISTQETVTFRVVKPFHCALILCHWSYSLSFVF